jgi:sugar fermentation stimulation protein A
MVGLLVPEVPLLLRPADSPGRATPYSVHRLVDGDTLVAVEASGATKLIEERLQTRSGLPGLGRVRGWRREVAIEGRRVDLLLELEDGCGAWLEVKSLSLALGGEAVFSRTPSSRGRAHLELLGALAERGELAACAFVVQRGDVRRLVADRDADPGWLDAVHRASQRGVRLMAFRCSVSPTEVRIERSIPIQLDHV